VRAIATGWRRARLSAVDTALCALAERLTRTPSAHDDDVAALRAVGLGDGAIHDAVQVIAYFNYINRVADGLDVDLEDFVAAWDEGEGVGEGQATGRGEGDSGDRRTAE